MRRLDARGDHMKRALVAAATMTLLVACVAADDRKAEKRARWLYTMAAEHAAAGLENCILAARFDRRGSPANASCVEAAAAEASNLLEKLEAYRASCMKCASAEKCESEAQRLRGGNRVTWASLREETACP
jgi:hypothetical protein